MSEPETDSSPPPYSPTPPDPITHTQVQRASSTPQFHQASSSRQVHYRSHPSSSAALAPQPSVNACIPSLPHQGPTSGDETDETSASDDGMVYTGSSFSLASSLRSRLLRRKVPGQDRPITTASNDLGITETETESDSVSSSRPLGSTIGTYSVLCVYEAAQFTYCQAHTSGPHSIGTLLVPSMGLRLSFRLLSPPIYRPRRCWDTVECLQFALATHRSRTKQFELAR